MRGVCVHVHVHVCLLSVYEIKNSHRNSAIKGAFNFRASVWIFSLLSIFESFCSILESIHGPTIILRLSKLVQLYLFCKDVQEERETSGFLKVIFIFPYLTIRKSIKNCKKVFLFHLKSSLRSRDIQIFIFSTSPPYFHVGHFKRSWLKINLTFMTP